MIQWFELCNVHFNFLAQDSKQTRRKNRCCSSIKYKKQSPSYTLTLINDTFVVMRSIRHSLYFYSNYYLSTMHFLPPQETDFFLLGVVSKYSTTPFLISLKPSLQNSITLTRTIKLFWLWHSNLTTKSLLFSEKMFQSRFHLVCCKHFYGPCQRAQRKPSFLPLFVS